MVYVERLLRTLAHGPNCGPLPYSEVRRSESSLPRNKVLTPLDLQQLMWTVSKSENTVAVGDRE